MNNLCRFTIYALGVLLLLGCSAFNSVKPVPDVYERIETEDQYMALVADRQLTYERTQAFLTIHPDGTMKGRADGRNLIGTWTWEGDLFCREALLGEQKIDKDCHKIETTDDNLKLRITRDYGYGSVSVLGLE